jgi:hypothetical protein
MIISYKRRDWDLKLVMAIYIKILQGVLQYCYRKLAQNTKGAGGYRLLNFPAVQCYLFFKKYPSGYEPDVTP